jgi:dolichyl-phosphate-mannose--protein O-mannosyl transferase
MGNLFQNDRAGVPTSQLRYSRSAAVALEPSGASSADQSSRKSFNVSWILDRPAFTAVILGVAGLIVFLVGIGRPPKMNYDENLFVPEAKTFLIGVLDDNTRSHNLAKPPLGKMILALGMKVAGDNPLGWRLASAVCGAAALPAVYLWTLLLLGDSRLAVFAAGLTLLNNFHFVMSRIGMMDVFLVFFLMWSLAAYTAALVLDVSARKRKILFLCSGVLIGLAGACKWNAIDTLAALILMSFALLWVARRSAGNSISSLSPYANNMQQIGVLTALTGLVIAPAISYCLTYWPLCRILQRPFSISELVAMHRYSWYICTTWVSNPSNTAAWYTWLLKTSPHRVLSYLLGNPVVTWGGLAALIFCLWRFWKTVALPEGMVVLLFGANYLQWVVTPEKGLFYYYYYPSVMILGVAIAVALRSLPSRIFGVRVTLVVLLIAAVIFVWCYPRMAYLGTPWDCALGCWT